MADVSVILPRLIKSLNLDLDPKTEHDKLKTMEDRVVRGVERSAMAVHRKDHTLALREAREATRALEVLKRHAAQLANDGGGSAGERQPGETQPMTTGVNLFDLTITAKCNLAAQLKNNGKLEEALDLCTQICKMAIDQTGSTAATSSFVSDSSSSSHGNGNQHQQQASRYLLFRFGLDVGNILFESREYQRALKYYRLTLDRLSSLSGSRHLRIKLMNNITVALMTMNGIAIVGRDGSSLPTQSTSQPSLLSKGTTNDHVTSLQLLLADNLLEPQNQQQQQQQSSSVGGMTAQHKHPVNSHHHTYGLNLLSCQFMSSSLDAASAMGSALKSLVGVDVCHHYRRVIKFHEPRSPAAHAVSGQTRTLLPAELARSPVSSTSDNTMIGTGGCGSGGGGDHRSPLGRSDHRPVLVTDRRHIDDMDAKTFGRFPEQEHHHHHHTEQVMRALQGDRLERVIRDKEAEIHRALIISCSLMIDLRRAHHANLDDVTADQPHNRQATNQQASTPGTKREQAAAGGTSSPLEQCLKLLAGGELYRELIVDLKTNNALRLISRKGRLSRALRALAEIDPYQRESVSTRDGVQDSTLAEPPQLTAAASSGDRARATKAQPATAAVDERLASSALVATNFGLIYLLKNQLQFAFDLCSRALTMSDGSGGDDARNAEALTNMASCQWRAGQAEQAARWLDEAYGLDQVPWTNLYNCLLASVKLGRHYDDLDIRTRQTLADHLRGGSGAVGGLHPHNRAATLLTQVQLATLHHQSNMKRDTNDLLLNLLHNARPPSQPPPPDILLMASKLIDDQDDGDDRRPPMMTGVDDDGERLSNKETTIPKSLSPIAILERALRLHPYHLAVAERLIALLIDNFSYTEARAVLANCIRNRPDQVKWYLMYAECHRRAANYTEAIQLYKCTMELFPLDTSGVRALAKLADELGLQDELRACQTKLQQLTTTTGSA